MKVSSLINHLEAFKREFGDVEVDCVAEAVWDHEGLIKHIVNMEDMLKEKRNDAGLQVEAPCTDVAYNPGDKHIKIMGERF